MSAAATARNAVLYRILPGTSPPAGVFERLYASEPHAFLYESLESHGQRGRYSFLGGRPRVVVESRNGRTRLVSDGESNCHAENPIQILRGLLRSHVRPPADIPFAGGAVGYLSYDAVRHFERIAIGNPDDLHLPEIYFLVPDEVVVFDHWQDVTHVCAYGDAASHERLDHILSVLHAERRDEAQRPAAASPANLPAIRTNMTRGQFEAAVAQAREYIRAGDIFQVVLSQRFEFDVAAAPLRLYRALRITNPSPYMYYLRADGAHVLGSSPEALVKLQGRRVTTRPLAGTRPRGTTPEQDAALEAELRADAKESAEHVMLVDLARNDLGRVCEFGSVRVTELMAIERYSRVMHLVSNVAGTLRPECDAFDLIRAAFPAGTVSGAPKIRAMQIIEELEPVRRGIYAGAIGYVAVHGAMDLCIAIRTMILCGRRGYVQAGAGIVADSVPEREYVETLNKANAVLRAVAMAQEAA